MANTILSDEILETFSLNQCVGGWIGNKIATPSNIIYHRLDVVANAIKHDTEIRGTMFGSISQTCSLERYFPEMLNSFFGARLLNALKILTFAMSLQEGDTLSSISQSFKY